MYGLVDCNNFYASCERVFNPSLNGKPIVVLSNEERQLIQLPYLRSPIENSLAFSLFYTSITEYAVYSLFRLNAAILLYFSYFCPCSI